MHEADGGAVAKPEWVNGCYGDTQALGPLFDAGPFGQSKIQPTAMEALVAGMIWKHKGRNNPISIARISELTKLSDRTIKGVVERLIVTHKIRIGARRDEPAGYFVIEGIEDLDAAVGPYKAQMLSMLHRLRVLAPPEVVREFLGQLKIEAGV